MAEKDILELTQYNTQTEKDRRVLNNTQNMLKVFQAFRKYQMQSGKAFDSPEILYINKKIQEFEDDLLLLNADIPHYQ
ncbi:hypothetical protein SDC9_181982 [bioreactor metagenome]|uniref:Uncharacterized protein n=1 Tax=bioreactor metagenome TaxID=1076179 RepID=A0A645H665_9ZZZZ